MAIINVIYRTQLLERGMPDVPGWYFRRRYQDIRSHWRPVKVPSRQAENRDRTAAYEWYGPINFPEDLDG